MASRDSLPVWSLRVLTLCAAGCLAAGGCKTNKDNNSPAAVNSFSPGPIVYAPPAPQPPAAPNNGSNCTAANACPPAKQDLVYNATNGGLVGVIGQPVNWAFYGRDLNTLSSVQPVAGVQGSSRRVMIILTALPPGAQANPTPNSTVLYNQEALIWTPPAVGNGTIQVVMRDYDRCMVTESNAAVVCNMVSQGAYDTSTVVPWQIIPGQQMNTMQQMGPSPATVFGNVLGGFVGSLINSNNGNNGNNGYNSNGATYSYRNQGQTYPDCRNNGGGGYGCTWACGSLWCAKDNSDLDNGSMCTVTIGGGSSCH